MKNLLITGGAGYLGRSLMRYLAISHPHVSCTVFSRDHGKHAKAKREFPNHRYMIGDVRDYDSIERVMAGHDTVVHAGAFKYVPEGETNVRECLDINVNGSMNVAMAAVRLGVGCVVGLSTDKACKPINVYGMSKAIMEKTFQDMNKHGVTKFNLCRYGNVVSSTGSAIPMFRRQAREDGVLTITDPGMTRFWLSVTEAVDLIMLALHEPKGGTILIPRLPSCSLIDVAKASVIMEVGNEPVEFQNIGVRFGEKQHEDLLGEVESKFTDRTGNVMYLWPMTTGMRSDEATGYNSGQPDRRMTVEEIIKYIEEAPE